MSSEYNWVSVLVTDTRCDTVTSAVDMASALRTYVMSSAACISKGRFMGEGRRMSWVSGVNDLFNYRYFTACVCILKGRYRDRIFLLSRVSSVWMLATDVLLHWRNAEDLW